MKKKTIAALAIVATTLASCINDDIVQDIDNANRTPLELTAGINTRATDATWNRADAIGVFTLATGTNTIAQGVSNFKYTNTADDGAEAIFAPANEENTAYYPINGDKVDVLAYYPYKQLTMDNGQLTIPVSVASQANLPAIDLMTAERVTGKHYDDAAVPLEFVHRLTKLNITLKKANEAAEIDLADARITIGGTPTTAVYNLNTQTFESFGEKADIELAAGGTGIVIPTAAGSGVNFKVEASGKTFTVTLPDNAALGSGEEAYITIKLRTFTEATITATIRPWTGGPTTAVEAVHFTLPNHPQTGAPEVTDFILYKNRGTNTEAFVDYSYNTYTAEWDATPAPFYIEDIKSGDTFTAVHTPQGEDPITGVTDVLQAPEATMVGGIINLEFAHINARLNVNLRKGESVGDIDLTTAQVSLLGYKLTGAGNTIVVNPGSIAAGTIGVKVGDKDFTVTHDAIALAAGTDNTLNITLSSRQDGKTIGGVEATVKAWTVVPAKELTAVNLTTPVDPVTGEPEVTTFTLYKNKGAGEVSVDYTYNTATKEWTANPAPFYVEDITATDKFTAVHTPAAGDAITGVKDVLEAAEVGMDLGTGVISLTFAHVNAKLNVNLRKGTGAEAVNLATATTKLLGYTLTGATNTIIVAPGTIAAGGITLTADGKTFNVDREDIALAAGTSNTLTLTLSIAQDGKTVAGVEATIKPWQIVDAKGLTAVHLTLPVDPVTGEPEVTTFTLYKNKGEGEVSVDYAYNAGTKAWETTGGAPFYVEDITATDKFTAVHTPAAGDAITQVKDILQTAEAGMNMTTGVISLEFAHVNAKLTVNLQKGTGAEEVDLSKATTQLLGYSLTGATNTIIVAPGTIAAGSITLTADGKTFNVDREAIALAAGTSNTLTLTLSIAQDGKTVAGVEAKMKEWETGANKALTAVNLVIPTNPNTNAPEVTTFTLYKNKGAAGEVSVNYTYNAGTSAWETSGGLPFYVEDIIATDKFTAVHTPAADDAITGVKDVLQTAEAGMNMGTGIIALTFAHVNAKLTVNLQKGAGAEAVNLATATTKLLGYTLTGATNTIIVAPGTIAAGGITLTADGKTFNVDREAIALAAGTSNTLTLTLSIAQDGKTVAGVEAKMKEWETGADKALTAVNLVIPTNPNTNAPEVTTFTLYKNKGAAGEVSVNYTYNAGTSAWETSGGLPFYVEDITATDKFTAVHTPAAGDAITGVKDVLQTGEVGMNMGTGVIALTFAHVNAKLTVNLQKGAGAEAVNLATATTKLLGYTLTGATNTIIVAPGTIAAGGITLTADGKTFNVDREDIALAAGTSNTLTLTLSIAQDGKTVAGVEAKMKEWETGADKALTAVNLVIPTNPNTNAPEVTTFTLYKNKGAGGEVSVNYAYNAGTSAWETSGGLPFYVEDITATDKFTAVHTPAADDAITGVKDVLQTAEAGMNMGTGIIALTFAHVNAKVSIVLKKGEGFPAGTNLATATVNFQGYTFTGEKTMLVAPATIAAGAQVATIAVGGHTYTVKTAAAITLAAGTQTVLTFTLIPSEAGISIGTADWGAEVKSGFEAQVDVTSGSDFSKLPAAGTVKITTGAFTGEYHWSGTTLTVVTPIYWNELSNAIAHNFALEFTPDAAGTPEKDVLAATANGVAWGMGIDFTNLTHKYAQFTVVLKKGTGYTDEEFATAAAAATVSLVGFSAANYDTTNGTASIVKPQTLTANHKVSVNIGGNIYGMEMESIFAGNVLEANKRYTLEATVNKNGTGISIGVIEDWGNGGTSSGELVH